MITKEFKIDGMSCNHCVMAVKNALKEFNPSELNVEIGTAVVSYDENKTAEEELAAAIEEEGYKVVN